MNGKFLIDTNIVIALFNNDVKVVKEISKAERIYLPAIVLGELLFGAYNSSNIKKNIKNIMDFARGVEILNIDSSTSNHYGRIKKDLKDIGKPIPENDIWISATAIQYQLPLVTRDMHFQNIKSIKMVKW